MMKHIKIFLLLLTINFPIWLQAQSRCASLDNDQIEQYLGIDFLFGGNTHIFEMSEGEEVLIFKTVQAEISYRFVVIPQSPLPNKAILIVKTWDGSTIFDNRNNRFTNTFTFKPDKTQRIKIYIKVPRMNTEPKRGCVVLLIGLGKV